MGCEQVAQRIGDPLVELRLVVRLPASRRDLASMIEPRHSTWNEGTEDEMRNSAVATTPE